MDALKPGEREVALRAKEVTERLVTTTGTMFQFYEELAAEGRELAEDERNAVYARLEAGALCLRDANSERDLLTYFALEEHIDFRPMVDVLRMMQRSLVLVLSDDPSRRKLAIPRGELVTFVRPVYEFVADLWGLPSWKYLATKKS